jgi:hypothetical protein
VARNDAKLFIRVPHGASTNSFSDPRSVRPWFEDSFEGFAAPLSRDLSAGYDWRVADRTLFVAPDLMAQERSAIEDVVANQRNSVQEMCVTLLAIKPGRGANVVANAMPPVRFSTLARLEPSFEPAPSASAKSASAQTAPDAARKSAASIYKRIYDIVYERSPIYAEQMDMATGRNEKDEIILGTIAQFAPKTLVDLGCGQGHYVRRSRQMGIDAVGVEVSTTCCEKYLQDVPHLNMDGETFLRRAGRYDFLLCTDVLEHIEPAEIDRLLQLAAPKAPAALFGIANHSDVQLGVELHLIREPSSWWIDRLRRVYSDVAVISEMYDGRFFFLLCSQSAL